MRTASHTYQPRQITEGDRGNSLKIFRPVAKQLWCFGRRVIINFGQPLDRWLDDATGIVYNEGYPDLTAPQGRCAGRRNVKRQPRASGAPCAVSSGVFGLKNGYPSSSYSSLLYLVYGMKMS